MTTTQRSATVRGTFIRVGKSSNNRLYSRPLIAKAVARMQESLASTDGLPLTMHTSHGAAGADDALSQVGKITAVGLRADGSATFEADIANTSAGKDIAALTSGDNPYVKGISIRGQWLGEMFTDKETGAMTAEDLQINGIDFTGRPGVLGAAIESVEVFESAMAADPSLIFESIEDVEFFEDETPDPSRALLEAARDMVDSADAEEAASDRATYADNGYKGEKRFPLDTMENTRSAWLALNAADISESYTAPQIKRMTAKVKTAAKKFGVDIVNEQAEFEQDIRDAIEAYASTCVQNAVASINVSAYTDPDKLAAVSATLAQAAAAALAIIDFDNDDDVDATPAATDFADETAVASIESADDTTMGVPVLVSNTCTHCSNGELLPESAMYCPTCGQPIAQAESSDSETTDPNMEATMADTTTEATDAAAVEAVATEAVETTEAVASTLTSADTTAIAGAVAEAMAAPFAALIAAMTPAAPAAVVTTEATTETAEPVVEAAVAEPVEEAKSSFTADEVKAMVAEAASTAVSAAQAAAVSDYRSSGTGQRKGFVAGANVGPADAHESSDDELRAFAEMDQTTFRKSAGEAILADPFFGSLNSRVNSRAFPG